MKCGVVILDKPEGLTTLQTIEKWRDENGIERSVKASCAGRLDPLASGLLVVLVGEENRLRVQYERSEKRYVLDVLFGVASDSFDPLGLVRAVGMRAGERDELVQALCGQRGRFAQPVPAFSATRVNGKPLFHWTKRGLLHTVEIPHVERTVHDVQEQSVTEMTLREVVEQACARVKGVQGNFRQSDVVESWQRLLDVHDAATRLSVVRVQVHCSAGTFMRTMAEQAGVTTGLGGMAWRIRRSAVGNYVL